MRQETLLRNSQRHPFLPIFISNSLSPSFQPLNSVPSSPFNNDDDGDGGIESGGASEVEDQRPRRSKPRKSLKVVENSQQRRGGLLGPKAKEPAKRHKPGKKALAAAAAMSQFLDAYVPPPSNTIILDS
jgi:hypothetical protein